MNTKSLLFFILIILSFNFSHSFGLSSNKSLVVDYENDYNYESTEKIGEELEIETISNNTIDSTLYENEEEVSKELCSIDDIIDQLIPNDYEEGKLLNISSKVPHINETFALIERIIKLLGNYTNNLSPITQKIMARLSSFIYEITLPSECMASIALIADAIANRQLWALKCKLYL
jgi:hypothetical protein